jgi:V/A-type H+-transporting ATPase subunit E
VNHLSVKNGISAISNEVIGDVQKEAEALIQTAETQAKESLKTANEQADQNYQAIVSQATAKAEAEKRKIASVTEVETRNRLLQTKEELVDVAFEKAIARVKNFVKTEEYRDYLLKLVEKMVKEIGQKDVVVQVNAKDKEWLTQDMLNRVGKKLRAEVVLSDYSEDWIGGCRIQTSDDKIIYDGTIDNRLQELKPTLRVEIAKMLFGKED